MVKKKRTRRSPEEAKNEILQTAERLLREQGPDGVRLKIIANELDMSHATLLYHFKSIEQLKSALSQRISRTTRDDLLAGLDQSGDRSAAGLFDAALAAVSDAERAPLLGWLIASGYPAFPDASEKGMLVIAEALAKRSGRAVDEVKPVVLLSVLAMFGEALVGEAVRERLDLSTSSEAKTGFRQWLIQLVARELRPEVMSNDRSE